MCRVWVWVIFKKSAYSKDQCKCAYFPGRIRIPQFVPVHPAKNRNDDPAVWPRVWPSKTADQRDGRETTGDDGSVGGVKFGSNVLCARNFEMSITTDTGYLPPSPWAPSKGHPSNFRFIAAAATDAEIRAVMNGERRRFKGVAGGGGTAGQGQLFPPLCIHTHASHGITRGDSATGNLYIVNGANAVERCTRRRQRRIIERGRESVSPRTTRPFRFVFSSYNLASRPEHIQQVRVHLRITCAHL